MTAIHSSAATFPQRRPLARAVALMFALGGSAQAATINVNSAADPGVDDINCTLREAIESVNGMGVGATGCANVSADPFGTNDTITFTDGLGQITLVGNQIDITEELIIRGPDAG